MSLHSYTTVPKGDDPLTPDDTVSVLEEILEPALGQSPAINLNQLATRVEAAHFPDPTANRDAPPPEATTPTGIYFLL